MDQGKTAILRASRRGQQINAFIAMDVLARANEKERDGEQIIHMEVGQPSTSAPAKVIEAAERALRDNRLGYTEALGLRPLREKVAAHYASTYGVEVNPECVVMTTGSSAGFILAFLAVLDEGARVALASPCYPCYRHILASLGNFPVMIDTYSGSRWAPSVEAFEAVHRRDPLQGVLLASPANPTGTMLSATRLAGLIEAAVNLGVWFISDEIYHGLTFETPANTALEFSENVIVINSFSKYFSMTGWRIGWMIVPPSLVRTIERLQQNLFISAPTLSQLAACAAFESFEELEKHRLAYQANRDVLISGLSKAGLRTFAPADGAFYLYADISDFSSQSDVFAKKMLDETGVASTSGLDFDAVRGGGYLRFSYAGSHSSVMDAVDRLSKWLPEEGARARSG